MAGIVGNNRILGFWNKVAIFCKKRASVRNRCTEWSKDVFFSSLEAKSAEIIPFAGQSFLCVDTEKSILQGSCMKEKGKHMQGWRLAYHLSKGYRSQKSHIRKGGMPLCIEGNSCSSRWLSALPVECIVSMAVGLYSLQQKCMWKLFKATLRAALHVMPSITFLWQLWLGHMHTPCCYCWNGLPTEKWLPLHWVSMLLLPAPGSCCWPILNITPGCKHAKDPLGGLYLWQ